MYALVPILIFRGIVAVVLGRKLWDYEEKMLDENTHSGLAQWVYRRACKTAALLEGQVLRSLHITSALR